MDSTVLLVARADVKLYICIVKCYEPFFTIHVKAEAGEEQWLSQL